MDVRGGGTRFSLIYFHARADYLQRLIPEGSTRLISGKLELFDGMVQMVHPDYCVTLESSDEIPPFEPIYPLTAGVTQKLMYKASRSALDRIPELQEWIDPGQISAKQWPTLSTALQAIHSPQKIEDLAPAAPARERLAYDEFFSHQLTLALARQRDRRRPGRETIGTGHLHDQVMSQLEFEPTNAQLRSIQEITADMSSLGA